MRPVSVCCQWGDRQREPASQLRASFLTSHAMRCLQLVADVVWCCGLERAAAAVDAALLAVVQMCQLQALQVRLARCCSLLIHFRAWWQDYK